MNTAAVVLHPHPSMGGDSSHPFVVEVAARLVGLGVQVATPDLSDPDVGAAAATLTELAEAMGADRVVLVGYSWGSVVTSHAVPAGLAARVLVAPPASMPLGRSSVETLVLVPEHDQYGGPDAIQAALAGQLLVAMEVILGADHFLWGAVDTIAARTAESIVISDCDEQWPSRFAETASALRAVVGAEALRIDHIGSTAVPGLAAKDLIDVQITVGDLATVDSWPDELVRGLVRKRAIRSDHVPAGGSIDPRDWRKAFWSRPMHLNVHVREIGRPNQRYPILFRDHLRASPQAAGAYASLKQALATVCEGDVNAYYAVKDPACDLIMAGAELWATQSGWLLPASDA